MAVENDMDLSREIVEDPEILSGTPVFRGTRVPVRDVAASVAKGISAERILAAYPSLDGDVRKLELACQYVDTHPVVERMARLSDHVPGLRTIAQFSVTKQSRRESGNEDGGK